ncbi:MAG TPA: hypothetical protein VE553_05615 [Candidatus Binatia bacterium]|nr:hypothetical protein [Candidatus Binatia bacterium]
MTPVQRHTLRALAAGWTLKVHRTLDGEKRHCLHPLEGSLVEDLDATVVESLREQGLIESNKKFPAATYLLTEKGRQAVVELGEDPRDWPLTARGWGADD